LAFAAVAVALAACGTRLPDSAFVRAQQQQAGTAGAGGGLSVGSGAAGAPAGAGSAGSGTTAGGAGTTGAGGAGAGTTAGRSTNGGSAARTGGGTTGPRTGAQGNTASDVGVTPTTITIGNIVSKTNAFDPRAFVGPSYGIEAFVNWTNAHGGVHGRRLVLQECDDQGTADGNTACVHDLLDKAHVFALVGNAILDYAGASYVNSKAVPDVGGQPIDNAYNEYPHLWDVYGEDYPRNGKEIGFNGKLYGGTEVYQYFEKRFPHVPKVAGVVEYNQQASERFGHSIAQGLQHEGYKVDEKVVNFALPDYDSVAIDFKNEGVQFVYDVIDRAGNVRLCKALDDNNVNFTAKVMTPQSWEQSVQSDYSASPTCRNRLWVTGNTRNFEDTRYQQVAEFRAQMAHDGHGGAQDLSEWALEGWGAGVWFADAADSCGARLTRRCLEAFINDHKPYDAHGLFTPRAFQEYSRPHEPVTNCINVARWQDGHGWVTQVPDMDRNCFRTTEIPYAAS
jgi:branched-chain amino acid transport system substrate-binding protein